MHRGHCTFLEKLVKARAASAIAIIIISDEETAINPTANVDEITAAGDINDCAVLLLPKNTGESFEQMVIVGEDLRMQIMLAVEPKPLEDETSGQHPIESEVEKDPNRILYINGLPLINTRLLV